MGDHRNYDPVLPYLDRRRFTYALADLRGYGLSRELVGRYDLAEAAGDVAALATSLGWPRFHVVGHSMSSLVAQQVAASAADRVASLVLLTPVLPGGMGAPDDAIEYLEAAAIDESRRREALAGQWGERLSPAWLDFKLRRWSESARPDACRGYVRMFGTERVVGAARLDLPVLAIVGGQDNPPFVEPTVRAGMAAAYARLEVAVYPGVGHYPMQEAPPMLASDVERFLGAVG
jgi:3-oxoadipate enol-lactonase